MWPFKCTRKKDILEYRIVPKYPDYKHIPIMDSMKLEFLTKMIEVSQWCSGRIGGSSSNIQHLSIIVPEQKYCAIGGDYIVKTEKGFTIYREFEFPKEFEYIK